MRAGKINIESVRKFYRRLNHSGYGITELAVIDPTGKRGVVATGFFDDENALIKACMAYNGRYNIYAGRNPRARWFHKPCGNYLDTRYRQRAKDRNIEYITAISLDIDPVRPKGTSATEKQHQSAIDFALTLHHDLSGWVDDSGNGAYLWFPFSTAIPVNDKNRYIIKQQCRLWQQNITKLYQPEKYGLRIDGCFDLSRLKKVIGTESVKGRIHRLSRFVETGDLDDRVRDAILAIEIQPVKQPSQVKASSEIPKRFYSLLKTNSVIRYLWLTPNADNDTSMHDWMLGRELVKAGISSEDIAGILMINPFGKYKRDRRIGYIKTTVNKLMEDIL